ncbi:hypothetical protein ACE6H2_008131 [Prunus campanulata]
MCLKLTLLQTDILLQIFHKRHKLLVCHTQQGFWAIMSKIFDVCVSPKKNTKQNPKKKKGKKEKKEAVSQHPQVLETSTLIGR